MAKKRTKAKRKKRNKQSRQSLLRKRSCGDCTECCVTLHISELNKPKHTRCENLCTDKPGCKIYSQRPTECMTFQCLWIQNELPENAKPNKTGVMAYYVESQFGPTVFVTETRQGALNDSLHVKAAALK